ncbi:ABC transporter permease [Parafilimonas sp.]|uniref:ABC transporter permease n=1 Tax=Parafilimonas sp. TaxID=1969739 RepID=UPI0039E21EE4
MIVKLIFQNLLYKPLATLLSIVLLMLGTGIISMLLLMQSEAEHKFDTDLKDIDLVAGAKGSPLQLVLSAVYQMDAPTGNIKKNDLDILHADPFIQQVIPLAYGDSYKGYRIVGTDSNYIKKYKAALQEGTMYAKPMDVVLGSNVAAATSTKLYENFFGTHGLSAGGEVHKQFAYKVTGILKPTNTVLDNLVLTPIESVWLIHHHKDEDELQEEKNTAGMMALNPNAPKDTSKPEDEITAALIKLRSPLGMMTLPRTLNQYTDMQVASPALEINRLFNLMGIGITTLQGIAYAIMGISALSVFISLYTRLKERKYEMALMRTMGGSRMLLFAATVAEGLLLCIAGFLLGIAISRLGIIAINSYSTANYHLSFTHVRITKDEWYLCFITIAIGFMAAAIPAVKASAINISKTLTNETPM